MPTLKKHTHVIVFSVLVTFMLFLQYGPFSIGWPIPLANASNSSILACLIYGSVRLLVNILPCIMLLSLAMLPFSYDSERSYSIAGLIVLMIAASLAASTLPNDYVAMYHTGEHALIYAIVIMAANGVLQRVLLFLKNVVELPDFRSSRQSD